MIDQGSSLIRVVISTGWSSASTKFLELSGRPIGGEVCVCPQENSVELEQEVSARIEIPHFVKNFDSGPTIKKLYRKLCVYGFCDLVWSASILLLELDWRDRCPSAES